MQKYRVHFVNFEHKKNFPGMLIKLHGPIATKTLISILMPLLEVKAPKMMRNYPN